MTEDDIRNFLVNIGQADLVDDFEKAHFVEAHCDEVMGNNELGGLQPMPVPELEFPVEWTLFLGEGHGILDDLRATSLANQHCCHAFVFATTMEEDYRSPAMWLPWDCWCCHTAFTYLFRGGAGGSHTSQKRMANDMVEQLTGIVEKVAQDPKEDGITDLCAQIAHLVQQWQTRAPAKEQALTMMNDIIQRFEKSDGKDTRQPLELSESRAFMTNFVTWLSKGRRMIGTPPGLQKAREARLVTRTAAGPNLIYASLTLSEPLSVGRL